MDKVQTSRAGKIFLIALSIKAIWHGKIFVEKIKERHDLLFIFVFYYLGDSVFLTQVFYDEMTTGYSFGI